MLSAQNQVPTLPTYNEPPEAESGDLKPAPASTVVIPGQPRPEAPRELDTGVVKQAQYVVPAPPPVAPRPQAPAVIYPEPPTPSVRISVKGLDVGPKGEELTYQLTVTNSSEARAHHVVARCLVPRGAKLVKALPQPVNMDAKELEWNLETLEPKEKRLIEVVFKPSDDATEISVVGKVQFEHGRVIKTRIVEPKLELKKTGPAEAIMHDAMTYKIVVSNPGKVTVSDVEVVDSLPEGLEYVRETANGAIPVSRAGPDPNQRTWSLGALKPGETRTLEYRVMSKKTGEWVSEAVVSGSGVHAKSGCNTLVQEAKITLQISGPPSDKGTANQPTPYLVIVHNTGTAILHNVRVICSFPMEMRMSKASNGGHMFHDAVQWTVPSLGPNETKELSVSLVAPSAGLRELVVSARGNHGLEQRKKVQTTFEGIPSLNWQAEGTAVAAPGQEIVYTVTVKNPGSAAAKNVKIIADLPEQVEFRQAQPAFQRGQGAVYFTALEIPPKETVTFKIVVVAKKAGEARFQFEMSSEGLSSGPLKNSRATTISPGAEPQKVDPSRIGSAPAPDNKKPAGNGVVPAALKSTDAPIVEPKKDGPASSSSWTPDQTKPADKSAGDQKKTDANPPAPLVAPPPEGKTTDAKPSTAPEMLPPLDIIVPEVKPPAPEAAPIVAPPIDKVKSP